MFFSSICILMHHQIVFGTGWSQSLPINGAETWILHPTTFFLQLRRYKLYLDCRRHRRQIQWKVVVSFYQILIWSQLRIVCKPFSSSMSWIHVSARRRRYFEIKRLVPMPNEDWSELQEAILGVGSRYENFETWDVLPSLKFISKTVGSNMFDSL